MQKPIPFGKYCLLERISVGGMAEVFKAKAFGVQGFAKTMAIKRILPSMAEDEEFVMMFIDEAKIAVQLNHSNICQIYELGKIFNSHYIVMEYIHGKDLLQINNYFKRRGLQMPIEMACFIMSKVCEGLDYAHRKRDHNFQELRLVHRDISPQNVLVSYSGEVKIIDFGIAKATTRSTKTQVGVLKGKFGYMSPEQVRGIPIDRRSDLFAAGTVLYEVLTAKRLFVADSDFATLEKVRKVDIDPPSVLRDELPQELERIAMKALARERDERYQWGGEFQEDLQRFMLTRAEPWNSETLSNWMQTTFADELARQKERDAYHKTLRSAEDLRAPDEPDVPLPDDLDLDGESTVIYAQADEGSRIAARPDVPLPDLPPPPPASAANEPPSPAPQRGTETMPPPAPDQLEDDVLAPDPALSSSAPPPSVEPTTLDENEEDDDDEEEPTQAISAFSDEMYAQLLGDEAPAEAERNLSAPLPLPGEMPGPSARSPAPQAPPAPPTPSFAEQAPVESTMSLSLDELELMELSEDEPMAMAAAPLPPPGPGAAPPAANVQAGHAELAPPPSPLSDGPSVPPSDFEAVPPAAPAADIEAPPPPEPALDFEAPPPPEPALEAAAMPPAPPPPGLSSPPSPGAGGQIALSEQTTSPALTSPGLRKSSLKTGLIVFLALALLSSAGAAGWWFLVVGGVSKPAPGVAKLLVQVIGSDGAEISLNNELVGTGDEVLLEDLEPGERVLTVRAHGFKTYTKTLDLPGGKVSRHRADLEAGEDPVARVRLRVTPSTGNITVTVDGDDQLSGYSPNSEGAWIDLTPSEKHTLKVQQDGFKNTVVEITLEDGEEREMAVAMARLMGTIRIKSIPAGARVELNGKKVGKTPWEKTGLPADKPYDLFLTRRGYEEWTDMVRFDGSNPVYERNIELLKLGGAPKTSATTSANSGYLMVTAGSDIWAKISIDGTATGRTTPIPSYNKIELPTGKHKLALDWNGKVIEHDFVIKKGETTKIRKRF